MAGNERRQVAEHPLQPHVLRFAGGLHLARVVIVQHAVGPFGHGHRRVPAFAAVDHVGLPDLARHVAPVGDEDARHGSHRQRQQGGDRHRDGEPGHGPAVPEGQHQRGQGRQQDEQLLRALCAEPDGQQEAGPERSDDGAKGVRRVHAADEPPRILSPGGHRRERERKTGAPQHGAGQKGEETPREIELKLKPGVRCERRIDRPVRQRLREHIRRPRHGRGDRDLTPGERDARPVDFARDDRADGAADAEPREEDGQDQGERVGRAPEQQRQRARPEHLARQRRQSRQPDRDVHRGAIRQQRRGDRLGRRRVMGRARRDRQRRGGDSDVDADRDIGGDGDVVDPQEVVAGEQAAEDGAGGVAPVEEAQPRHAPRRCLDPARDRRQRRAHEQRRRQQARGRGCAANEDPEDAGAGPGRVDAPHDRHPEQHREADDGDADLQHGVDTERMPLGRDDPRQQQAAQAHAAHEGAEQHAHRNGRRPDHQLQQLEPDDLVDEGGASAADKQQQHGRKEAFWLHARIIP